MRRPKALAEVLEATSPVTLFETVPAKMAQHGRVEGFEALRDLLLNNWQTLSGSLGIPLQALLKLVLETDRHALFAMMAEEKLGETASTKNKTQRWFQDYLKGEVDEAMHPDNKLMELPSMDFSEDKDGGE